MEQHWGDVHQALIAYARDQLQPRLPSGLRARMQERIFLQAAGEARDLYPDMQVVERVGAAPAGSGAASSSGAGVATAEPLLVHINDEPVTQGYVEIIDTGSGGRVITVIEFLSPSNKFPGRGKRLYLRKRRELRRARVSLVEIDLVRQGKRVVIAPQHHLLPQHRSAYQVCVCRGTDLDVAEVYPVRLRERLPVISVPLRPGEPDVPLDLQPLVDQAYSNGGYEDIDYSLPPDPPLAADDAAWAKEVVGMRKRV